MTDELVQEFERDFWPCYPRKVAKFDALKAYGAARKTTSKDDILAGVARYKASKPAWQEWAYPASWLRAGRWLDEVAPAPAPVGQEDWRCHHKVRCNSPQWHMVVMARERGEV